MHVGRRLPTKSEESESMETKEILEFKIGKLKTYLNSFGGNSANVKMKTVAIKRKLYELEEKLKEAQNDT